jgi:predicted PurR-regulated permease PerM
VGTTLAGAPPLAGVAAPGSAATAAAARRARLLIAALVGGVLFALLPFLPGLLGAVILRFAAAPVHRRFVARLGARGAAVASTLLVTVALLAPAMLVTLLLVQQTPQALRALENGVVFRWLAALRLGPLELGTLVSTGTGSMVAWLSRQAFSAFGSLTRATLNLLVALFTLYYLLRSHGAEWRWVVRVLPFSAGAADRLRERFHAATEAMVLGVLLTALLQGVIVGAAFAAVGLSDPLFWGVVTGCVSVLPVLGSSLVWLPGVIVLLSEGRYAAAGVLAFVGAVFASNLDNLLRPIVYRRVSNLHPLTTLVGAFAGARLFGIVGLLLGPLAITYVFELVRLYEAEYGSPIAAGPSDGAGGGVAATAA